MTGDFCNNIVVYFDFDRSILRGDARNSLKNLAKCLKTQNRNARVEGHADERGTTEYNVALSDRIAEAVARYFEDYGILNGSLSTIGYGDRKPVIANAMSPGDHARNRRVEIKLD